MFNQTNLGTLMYLWMPACNDCAIITQDYPLFSVSRNLPSQISFWNFKFHFFLLFFRSEFLGSIINSH